MKKKSLVLSAFVICVGLIVWKYVHRAENLKNPPIVLGHGGMGVRSILPLNSMASVTKALSYPIQGTEVDIRITADGQLVAFHSESLSPQTNCSGLIAETDYSDLQNCENTTWLKSANIERVADILKHKWPDGTTFSLDVKDRYNSGSDQSNKLIDALTKLTKAHPQFSFIIESMDLPFLAKLKRNGAKAQFFFYAHDLKIEATNVSELGLDGVSIKVDLTSDKEIAQTQELGLKVMLWGTGSVFSNRNALKMKADIIQTDDIGSMVKLLR